MFNMKRINILWSFSSIEASIFEIFAIKNCYFLALIFVERSEKLSVKTACDVNVGQVKKSGKFKTVFFESTWRRHCVVFAAINLERTSNLSSKVASCGYNLIISFSRRMHHSKTDFNDSINFLAQYMYWKCTCVGPIFFKMYSQDLFI